MRPCRWSHPFFSLFCHFESQFLSWITKLSQLLLLWVASPGLSNKECSFLSCFSHWHGIEYASNNVPQKNIRSPVDSLIALIVMIGLWGFCSLLFSSHLCSVKLGANVTPLQGTWANSHNCPSICSLCSFFSEECQVDSYLGVLFIWCATHW